MVRAHIPPSENLGGLRETQETNERRLNDLERTDGAQFARAWEKIKSLMAGLGQTVQDYIAQYSYTRQQIQGLGWLGVLPPAKGGTGTENAANNTFTSGGPWYVAYVKADGSLGHVPSLTRLKQDVAEAFDYEAIADDPGLVYPTDLLEVPVRRYRFIDDVAENGDAALDHFGFLAEEIEELGFEPLLQRDLAGELVGVAYDRVWVYHHEILRAAWERLVSLQHENQELAARVAALEERLD